MKRKNCYFLRKSCSVLLIAALLFSFAAFFSFSDSANQAYGLTRGTFRYGAVIEDAEGKPYSWKKSMMAPAYWWDAKGNKIAGESLTYESATAGLQRYTIDTEDGNLIGYCVAHGVRVDTTSSLRAEEALENWVHTDGYPESSKKGIEFALLYGYQQGRHIWDLADMGFSSSKYWHKSADSYTLGDWYIATQVLIWEYQQLIRTDSLEGGHGRQENGLVEANHYYDIVKGRAAADIYNFMAMCIKKHGKAASFAESEREKAEASAGWKMEKDETTGYYTCILQDGNQIGVDIEATGTSAENWEIKREGNRYTFIYKGENLDEEGVVFRFGKKIPLAEIEGQEDLLIWSWSSGGGLRQAVATGVPRETAPMYIKFRSGGAAVAGERPKPEYWPVFQFPVHKDDVNPGWDGDVCTPMGDGELSSTFVLYRNGTEVDRVTLDEYGNTQVLTDQPWISPEDLHSEESGSYTHVIPGDPPSTHCVVAPTRIEWTSSEEIEYEIREIPADGRFSEEDGGTGTGKRRYQVSYYAVTEDHRTCIEQEPQWSEIQYQVIYRTTEGRILSENPQAAEKKAEGTRTQLSPQLTMEEEVWINDIYRGNLLLKKQKEAEDIFEEEGSSGSLALSVRSKWKMYLASGGLEEHPYIRFYEEGYTETGARKYRVVRDTSGENNGVTDMIISDTGSVFITDIPYGTYIVEEVAADDESFVLEKFEIFIGEDGKQYTKSVTNKKKENVIKIVKTDGETGKPVDLKGTKFYIRYMGNPLLSEPSQSENYGRLLQNGTDIHSGEKDYTFSCNAQGEIVIPYDLEFGTYRLEEFLLPEGYFVGTYDQNGEPSSLDFGLSGEYEKDDDGTVSSSLSWNAIKDEDPSNDWIAVYDENGNPVSYKAGDVFNYYTFQVEKQESHTDGEEYVKYYKAVAMKNNPVKGRIEIEKTGEVLEGFQKNEKNGFTVWTPSFVAGKVKGAVFGIFAAADQWRNDGSEGMKAYDSRTEQALNVPMEKRTHSGVNGQGKIYEEGRLHHSSGADLYYYLEREASAENRYTQVYTSPEQRPSGYAYQLEREENGLRYYYNLDVSMENNAGGSRDIKIFLMKTTSPVNGYMAEIPVTEATARIGEESYTPAVNVETGSGNVLDVFYDQEISRANEDGEADEEGDFQESITETYQIHYTGQSGANEDFTFLFDGIRIHSGYTKEGKGKTEIESPANWDVKPEIHRGIGYSSETEGNKTVFTSSEPSAPLYFMTETGIRTEMYLYGKYVRARLTIPMDAVEKNYGSEKPTIVFTQTGEVVNWLSDLSPDMPVYEREIVYDNRITAVRHEGDRESDVFYTVEILTNQTEEAGAFEIIYEDGYTARVYKDKSEEGNDVGVMKIEGEYKTSDGALSDLIETVTTDENGKGVSSFLPLGKYVVRELEAPEGYLLPKGKGQIVNLSYRDQYTPLVWEQVASENETFSVEIDIEKVFETGAGTDQYIAGGGAVFGIYNAFPISYGKNELAADTLLDTAVIEEDGKTLKKIKLPEGFYYLRELSTRPGYQKNEIPYYFYAGDSILSSPLFISHEEEGKDEDGMTVKGVMDGYGKAAVAVEVLTRYPAAQMELNGRVFSLDQEVSEEGIQVQIEPDMTKVRITVEDGQEAKILLPNGKFLNFYVEGNLYYYTYDGVSGVYMPQTAYTAYYAAYREPETLENLEQSYVFTAAEGASSISVHPVSEGISGKERVVKLETGHLREVLADEEKSEQEMRNGIKIQAGERLKLQTEDNAIYLISLDADGRLEIEEGHYIQGRIEENDRPVLMINGEDKTEDLRFFKNVTLARQDRSAEAIQIKINTADDVNSAPIKNRGGDKPDVPENPEEPGIPEKPERVLIEFIKLDSETGELLLGAEIEVWSAKIGQEGKYVPDQMIYSGKTGTDGKLVFDMTEFADENWFYREIKAPDGYMADDQYHMVYPMKEKKKQITVFNEKITGSLEILKLDGNTEKPLEGAVFEIRNSKVKEDGSEPQIGEIIFQGNTDEQGKLIVAGLEPGTYWYREIQAPDGYQRDEKYHKFQIEEDGNRVKAVVKNEKQEVTIPKTGDKQQLFVWIWMMAAALAVLLILWKKREENAKKG